MNGYEEVGGGGWGRFEEGDGYRRDQVPPRCMSLSCQGLVSVEVDPGDRSWKSEAQGPGLKIKTQEVKEYKLKLCKMREEG